MIKRKKAPYCWDDRTETISVRCFGGPLDGSALPMPPGVRTLTRAEWHGAYYEVMWGFGDWLLVWHSRDEGTLWLDVAARKEAEGNT